MLCLLFCLGLLTQPYWDSLRYWGQGSFGRMVLADYGDKDVGFTSITIRCPGHNPPSAKLTGQDYQDVLAYLQGLEVKTILPKNGEQPEADLQIRINGRQKEDRGWATHYHDFDLVLSVVDADTLTLREVSSETDQLLIKGVTFKVLGGLDSDWLMGCLDGQ